MSDWYSGTIPRNVRIEDGAYVESSYSFHCFRSELPDAVEIGRGAAVYTSSVLDLGPAGRVRIGEFAMLNGARVVCDSNVDIGAYSMISWNVVITDTLDGLGGRVELEQVARRHHRVGGKARPVRIGPNVWIGFDVCVLPGVTIGVGSVIGAGSVVDSDVPPFSVFAGVPARLVRPL